MGRLVNEFSWSMSRASKFDTCARSYYFHYYGSWGGWERGADPRSHELWILKKLTSRQAWSGSTVHDTIAWALGQVQHGEPLPDLETATARMHRLMQAQFRESRDGAYRRRKALGLVEHEYDEALDDAVWKENWERTELSLRRFYESEVLPEILDVPTADWFPIDALDTFEFEGIKVYVAPDFAFRDAEGRLRILDWKTGRPREKDQSQVRGYVLFAIDRWRVTPEEALAELHYLREGEVQVVDVDAAALAAFEDELRRSVAAMRGALDDVDANRALPEAFPPIAEAAVCRRCNFRGACEDAVLPE